MRTRALAAVGAVGPAAREHVAAIQRSLEDPDQGVRLVGARAMRSVTGSADLSLPVLIAGLKHEDAGARVGGGLNAVLLRPGRRAGPRRPRRGAPGPGGGGGPGGGEGAVVHRAVGGPDPARRGRRPDSPGAGLEPDGAGADRAGPDRGGGKVADGLRDEDVLVRRAAADALGRMGPAAHAAVGGLARALSDPDVEVRRLAAWAIARTGREAERAMSSLILALADADEQVRLRAFSVLSELGEPAVGGLEAALTQPDARLRAGAAATLGEIGKPAARSLDALRKLLDDPDPEVRSQSKTAIEKIEK